MKGERDIITPGSPFTFHVSPFTLHAVSRHQAVEKFARPDHSEFLAGDALLFRGIALDSAGKGLQGVNGRLQRLNFGLFFARVAPELDPVARAVLPTLKGKDEGQQDNRGGGPAYRRHSEYRSRPG